MRPAESQHGRGTFNSHRAQARRWREQQLQKEAEEALLLQQYLRRKQAERELVEEREAKRLRDYQQEGLGLIRAVAGRIQKSTIELILVLCKVCKGAGDHPRRPLLFERCDHGGVPQMDLAKLRRIVDALIEEEGRTRLFQ